MGSFFQCSKCLRRDGGRSVDGADEVQRVCRLQDRPLTITASFALVLLMFTCIFSMSRAIHSSVQPDCQSEWLTTSLPVWTSWCRMMSLNWGSNVFILCALHNTADQDWEAKQLNKLKARRFRRSHTQSSHIWNRHDPYIFIHTRTICVTCCSYSSNEVAHVLMKEDSMSWSLVNFAFRYVEPTWSMSSSRKYGWCCHFYTFLETCLQARNLQTCMCSQFATGTHYVKFWSDSNSFLRLFSWFTFRHNGALVEAHLPAWQRD